MYIANLLMMSFLHTPFHGSNVQTGWDAAMPPVMSVIGSIGLSRNRIKVVQFIIFTCDSQLLDSYTNNVVKYKIELILIGPRSRAGEY